MQDHRKLRRIIHMLNKQPSLKLQWPMLRLVATNTSSFFAVPNDRHVASAILLSKLCTYPELQEPVVSTDLKKKWLRKSFASLF
jgi:hypothetical protein